MPKQPLQEIFSQGLVTSRPSHMLSSGELVRADHTVYRENNVALQRAPDHGYYSPDNLSTYFENSSVTGIMSANFDGEEYPDQLIVRVGNDLLSSNVTGGANNTFSPITSPGRVTVTFDETPQADGAVDFEDNVIYPDVPTMFDGIAIVGRAIWSETAFPLNQTTVITAVTVDGGGSVISITVSTPSLSTVTEVIHFAPKCLLQNGYLYSESIGFSAFPIGDSVMKNSSTIASSRSDATSPNQYVVRPPSASATAFNDWAAVGRKVSVVNPALGTTNKSVLYDGATQVNEATILKIDFTGSNVNKIYLDKVVQVSAGFSTLSVVFKNNTTSLTITAVDDIVEDNQSIPVYSSCYFNWFPPSSYISETPTTSELIFSAGLARQLPVGDAPVVDGLSWDGSVFLWDGVNTTQRLEYRAKNSFNNDVEFPRQIIARPAGLRPVISSPTVTRKTNGTTVGGAWNANLATGIYWLLITEAYIPSRGILDNAVTLTRGGNFLESAYLASNDITAEGTGSGLIVDGAVDTTKPPVLGDSHGSVGRPIPFRIDNVTTDYIEITMPAPRNNGSNGFVASHWCVYIAGQTESWVTPPPLTSFTRTHVAAMTQYSAGQVITLKDYQQTQVISLTSVSPLPVKGFPQNWIEYNDDDWNEEANPGWESFSGDYYRNRVGYFAHGDWLISGVGTGIYSGKAVSGIKVYVPCIRSSVGRSGSHPLSGNWQNQASEGNSPYWSADLITASSSNCAYAPIRTATGTVKEIGGPNETWGLDSSTADWSSLRLRLAKATSARGQALVISKRIEVVVYYTTTTINFNGPSYRAITYRSQVGSADISDPASLPPPTASIGDTFQGSLVLNDSSATNFIRYSLPDQPEYFPAPYRMRMGTKRKGKITALKAFKQILIVGMERSIKRVNYLPKETDTDFTQGAGLSHEDISVTHGIVGPNAITDFDMPGMGPMIAYVSTIGLRMTGGSDSRALNTDVILKDYVHPDHWDKCILKAFPNQKWLILYYVPKGSTHGVRSKCLVYSYSEDHIKGGATIVLSGNPPLTGPLPVTGPCDCYVEDACEVIINSSPQVATTDGEFIFIEDSLEESTPVRTVTDADDATKVDRVNVPNIKSRDLFPAGFTMDGNIGSVYLMHETKGSQYVVTGCTSSAGTVTLYTNTSWGDHTPQVGERVIHGGWDSPPSILSVGETSVTVSSPAVRSFTGSATIDTGVVLIRVNAAMFGEDEVPILSEYRSTSVGVGQAFLMDATANRFSVEVVKTENPNTGDLNDLKEDMSIIGVVYHAANTGETTLHAN